ncbi:hypothetical protein GCM10020229_05220 [Kitasatospora albolonga]
MGTEEPANSTTAMPRAPNAASGELASRTFTARKWAGSGMGMRLSSGAALPSTVVYINVDTNLVRRPTPSRGRRAARRGLLGGHPRCP